MGLTAEDAANIKNLRQSEISDFVVVRNTLSFVERVQPDTNDGYQKRKNDRLYC